MKSLLLITAGAVLVGCGREAPKSVEAHNAAPVAVRTITVAETALPAFYEATGTVRARTAAVISAKVMGYVREVRVRAGDRVRRGETLVILDSRDLEAGYRQAEAARNEVLSAQAEVDNAIASAKANLDLAETTFKRMQDLFSKRSISNQEFDEAQARVKVARAGYEMALAKREQLKSKTAQAEQGLASAEVMRSYAQLTAPFDGVVTDKTVEPGNLAAPGQPLLTIEQSGVYRLEAAVEESRLATVRPGQTVAVMLDALSIELHGRVSEIVPAVDAASRSFIVKIDLPGSPQLRSGLFGRARFPLGAKPAITAPAEALIERGQVVSVYVADAGRARVRLVTIGQRTANGVEVLSGLGAGDRVIVPVPVSLADGARVEVRP